MGLTIDQALERGFAAYQAGDLQEADRLYRAVLQTQPTHPDANHALGLVAASANKPKAALQLFKTALEADPKIEKFWISYIDALVRENHLNVAKAVLAEGRKMGLAGEKVDVVEARLSQIGLSESSYLTEKNKGQSTDSENPSQQQLSQLVDYFKRGQFAEAEKVAKPITEKFPGFQFGWKVLGVLLGQTGRNSEALQANLKAVELSPEDDEAHSNLGNVLRKLGRFEEAEVSCKQAVLLNPDFAGNHNNLGVTLQEMGNLAGAEASYRQAIALESDFAEAHSNLAGSLRELGRLAEAEASCRQAITLRPESALAYYDLAILLRELGRLEEAETQFRQAIALKPDFAEVHNSLGGTLREQGKLEEAETSYRQSIALDSDFALAHCNLAVALKDLGRYEEAEASCRHALALNPDFGEAHYNLGTLLFEKKQYKKAGEQFALADMYQSQLFAIKCSYHNDEQSAFTEKLDALVNQGEVNAVIGSLSCCSEAKYGIERSNPFCAEPLKYVSKVDLNEDYDFENIFVKPAQAVLADPSVSHKAQVHLSNGIQTAGNFFTLERVLSTEIEKIIRLEIEKYRSRFKDSEEGFIAHWPDNYEVSGWLVSMQSGGTLTAHMHDTGWITGSLYINVPAKSKIDSGNLVLRMHDQELRLEGENSQEASIDVRTGSLCFFPSSLLHHTVPFEENENRIVLAFDVIPQKFLN